MSTKLNLQKKVDLPPSGARNADPITDQPGSHPIETGIGAVAAGAATGIAAGAVGGPVSAALGAAIGAVAGGYVGKSVGEMIDPTTEDHWLRDNFESRPYVEEGDNFEDFQPAYRYERRPNRSTVMPASIRCTASSSRMGDEPRQRNALGPRQPGRQRRLRAHGPDPQAEGNRLHPR